MGKYIDKLISKHGLGNLQSVYKPGQGMMTENVIIKTEKGLFFIKQRSEWLNDAASIQAHYELIDFMVKNGFPTPELITKKPENIDNACFDIYKGIEADNVSPASVEAGRLLGRFHKTTKNYGGVKKDATLSDINELNREVAENIEKFKDELRKYDLNRFIDIRKQIAIEAKDYNEYKTDIITGDFDNSQIVVSSGKHYLVDLDDAGTGDIASDLADGILSFSGFDSFKTDIVSLKSFISGYKEIEKISANIFDRVKHYLIEKSTRNVLWRRQWTNTKLRDPFFVCDFLKKQEGLLRDILE